LFSTREKIDYPRVAEASSIATSTRFGVERRDRRLAALRLVGVDANTSRAVASTEAVIAALIGVLVGSLFFAVGRKLLEVVSVQGISVFP